MKSKELRYSPTICLTYDCNLNCTYCYQTHGKNRKMSYDTAIKCVDKIFSQIPENTSGVTISFIGGEPLLEFDMIRRIVAYVESTYPDEDVVYDVSTNGTLLTEEMKEWFIEHKSVFSLGLSLDGTPEVHNFNRCNSYSLIDIDFFLKHYRSCGVKMTISEYSLAHLAECIKYIHSLGFCRIVGVNLFEGAFDWSDEKYIRMIIPQLEELDRFYVENPNIPLDQMFDKFLPILENAGTEPRQWCGIGTNAVFFDIDGTQRQCPFCTPMTFSEEKLKAISEIDFHDKSVWADDCFRDGCYLYPICPHCTGANFLNTGSTTVRDRSKCKLQKLIALYSADVQAKRLIMNPEAKRDGNEQYLIKAVEKLRALYLPEFAAYMKNGE